MLHKKIIEKPAVTLQLQPSRVTCWAASAYMLFNWKNLNAVGFNSFLDNLPTDIFGIYTLENFYTEQLLPIEVYRMNSASKNFENVSEMYQLLESTVLQSKFNNAVNMIDHNSAFGFIYRNDYMEKQSERRREDNYNYFKDYLEGDFNEQFQKMLTFGLPFHLIRQLFLFARIGFKPVGTNKLYDPIEWAAMLNYYGPLLVFILVKGAASGESFGHAIIVDGFYGESSFNPNECQIYIQDPATGTQRGKMFPHFQAGFEGLFGALHGNISYIWHSGKPGINNLNVEGCVRKLREELNRRTP